MECLGKAIDALDRIDECINAYDDALTVLFPSFSLYIYIYIYIYTIVICFFSPALSLVYTGSEKRRWSCL